VQRVSTSGSLPPWTTRMQLELSPPAQDTCCTIPPRSHGPGGPKERWHRVGFIGLSSSPLIVNTISLTAHISRPGPFHRCTTDRHLGFVTQSAMPFLVPQHVATTPREAIGVRQCQLHHFSTFRSTPATFTVQVIPGPNSHHSAATVGEGGLRMALDGATTLTS